jgi:hypothetical protein
MVGFSRGQISKQQRRGAIIILGMLAKADTEMVSEKIDLMLRIGLGPVGKVSGQDHMTIFAHIVAIRRIWWLQSIPVWRYNDWLGQNLINVSEPQHPNSCS